MDINITKAVKEVIYNNERPHLVFRAATLPYLLKRDGYNIETEIENGEILYFFNTKSGKRLNITDRMNECIDLGIKKGEKLRLMTEVTNEGKLNHEVR